MRNQTHSLSLLYYWKAAFPHDIIRCYVVGDEMRGKKQCKGERRTWGGIKNKDALAHTHIELHFFRSTFKLWQKCWLLERLRFQFWLLQVPAVRKARRQRWKGEGSTFGKWQELGAKVIIYLSCVCFGVCVCVCEKTGAACVCVWAESAGGGGVLKVSVDDLHAPSSRLLGRKKRHGWFLQPAWPQSPLYTRPPRCLPSSRSSSSLDPSLFRAHTELENK